MTEKNNRFMQKFIYLTALAIRHHLLFTHENKIFIQLIPVFNKNYYILALSKIKLSNH